jgi:hypothetical protein
LLSFGAKSFVFQLYISNSIKSKIYRTVILLLVLYGCEAWSVILREVRRLMVFENSVLGQVCGPKNGEVTGVAKTI